MHTNMTLYTYWIIATRSMLDYCRIKVVNYLIPQIISLSTPPIYRIAGHVRWQITWIYSSLHYFINEVLLSADGRMGLCHSHVPLNFQHVRWQITWIYSSLHYFINEVMLSADGGMGLCHSHVPLNFQSSLCKPESTKCHCFMLVTRIMNQQNALMHK